MFIAERLKKCREDKNLSLEDLTFELDKINFRITRQTLYNWETGETVPNVDALVALATYFKKPLKYFFD
jgi:transcriptional regulator with XRE-family HTH domain